jgi:ABC-type multidrug transport system ATPase subunit
VPLHRRQIGVVFQDYRLLEELNVWENIALALSIVGIEQTQLEQRVSDLLKLVDLAERAHHFPQQLSGGEAQRVSIARALSTAPKLIFADEPTGNLDSETSARIIQLLKKINELGTTIMITTHDPEVKELLKGYHHIHLEKGTLVTDSAPSSNAPKAVEPTSTPQANPTPEQPKTRFALGLAKIGSFFSKKSVQKTEETPAQETEPPSAPEPVVAPEPVTQPAAEPATKVEPPTTKPSIKTEDL